MAVVKADGYGHGMIPIAQTCMKSGVQWFGTATIDEAITLRKHGISRPILVLGVTSPHRAFELVHYQISQVVPSLAYANELNKNLHQTKQPLQIHIGVDTGMGRLGWLVRSATIPMICDEIQQLHQLNTLHIEGLMTHLSSARGTTSDSIDYTMQQLLLFHQLCSILESRSIAPKYKHALNSGGFIHYPNFSLDMIRIGHLLCEPLRNTEHLGLQSAMEIKATIAHIKELPKGAYVGYGRTYQLQHSARIAVVNIGYGDGYPRLLSNKGTLLLHGMHVPVIGSVCMDQTMIDISKVPNAKVGDIVTIVGRDGDAVLTMEDISGQSGGLLDSPFSINLTTRTPRYYKQNSRLLDLDQTIHLEMDFCEHLCP